MELVQCPRCHRHFECCAGNISICGCMDIVLSAVAKQYLAEHYESCLCNACLRAVKDWLEKHPENVKS